MADRAAVPGVAALLAEWLAARAELAELERAEHPPLTDRWGREWTWWKGDLYLHDDALCFPRSFIESPTLGLPSPELADNPNYPTLCATCRQHWPAS